MSDLEQLPEPSNSLVLTIEEVQDALHTIDGHKGRGPDDIHPIVLKNCAASLAPVLTVIFNKSLSMGVFPRKWKTASIVPIFKSGSRGCVENYRGISKLPTLGKLFESIVYKKLYTRVAPLISSAQHGFYRHRSCTSNLTQFVCHTVNAMEEGRQVDALFTDFTKAFHRVDHSILMRKLFDTGLDRLWLKWLHSYLSDRPMFVKIGSSKSRIFKAKSGVPQGSHLGPLLFLLFINDVIAAITFAIVLLYADDLKLYMIIKDHTSAARFQQDIDALHNWCVVNRLDLNVAKCKVMTFGRMKEPSYHQYKLGTHALQRVSEFKDLGVHLDPKLSFVRHVEIVTAKAHGMLGFIKRICSNMSDPYALKSVYCAFVRSNLEFACVVWNPFYDNSTAAVESIQKQFVIYALRRLGWSRDTFVLPP